MTAYIPNEWYRDIGNKDAVSKLFADIPDTDIFSVGFDLNQSVIDKLSELGEETILKHYQEGYFVVG